MPYVKSTVKKAPKKTKKASLLKSLVSLVEVKFLDTNFAAVAIPAGPGTVIDDTIVNIPNGTSPQERIGRKIRVVGVEYSGHVYLTSAGSFENFRYDVILDRQPNGLAPDAVDIYTGIAGTAGTNQYMSLVNEKRFLRLHSRTFTLNTSAEIAGVRLDVGRKIQGKFKCNIVVEYSSAAGVVGSIASNNLFQTWSSDYARGATGSISTRILYLDI